MPQRVQHRQRIIALLALSTAGLIGAFAVWRAARGDWQVVALDCVVVVAMVGLVLLSRSERRVDLAGSILSGLNGVFCVAGIALIGPAAQGWVYLALISNFYIAPARVAALSSGSLVCAATFLKFRDGVGLEEVTTLITWIMVWGFSYIFAFQTQVRHGSLEELASMDPLTGLPNRRAMEAQLELAVKERRGGRPGLLVLDIDKFKVVNDTYGHARGDRVLEDLARVLRHELRQRDRVYRFGGEEFVLLLPPLSQDALKATAERVREAVQASVASPAGPITVSIGAALARDETAWQDWFSRADEALYVAKRGGGNRVCLDEEEITSGPSAPPRLPAEVDGG